ncbi:DJ-1/PfpI family protein [Nocardioides sp. zg-579]|uniref:DJ-1/PfpI family protein n=1 Tax=Nocardioides marmotae TaxID=2663857 RepID=A0A6I3JA12_9ACTN|nr:DJ-1/PfpI family protein [Gordonia jinghuaiqii]MTB95150.1 DJ-1/PfpI family protein [Nocardioides marmotae]QKE02363.1 DJ-1/PfpI family protein [Nocardioides marmotae]
MDPSQHRAPTPRGRTCQDAAVSTRTVAILAFDDMEVLDFAGPYEVFNVAGELGEGRPFEVVTVGLTGEPAVGRGGFTVLPDHRLDDCPPVDVLVVPGGAGTRRLLDDEHLATFLRERYDAVELLMSVCTGSMLLARAGLLAGRPATTHHTTFEELAAIDPSVVVERGSRFVRSGERLWTSAGVSAGIDLALTVVEELAGPATRAAAAAEMEWMWGSAGAEGADRQR